MALASRQCPPEHGQDARATHRAALPAASTRARGLNSVAPSGRRPPAIVLARHHLHSTYGVFKYLTDNSSNRTVMVSQLPVPTSKRLLVASNNGTVVGKSIGRLMKSC